MTISDLESRLEKSVLDEVSLCSTIFFLTAKSMEKILLLIVSLIDREAFVIFFSFTLNDTVEKVKSHKRRDIFLKFINQL